MPGGVWIRSAEGSQPGMRGTMSTRHQDELARAFNMPSRPGGRGVYVMPTRAWRHEMLDRLAGTDSGIKGMRFSTPTDADVRN